MIISVQLIRRTETDPNRVIVNGTEITPGASLLIYSHSPDWFDWGYYGSGPSQTALAICLHLFGPHIANRVYQKFKVEFVANWKDEGSYTVNLSGFYQQFIEPNMPDYMAQWMDFLLNQLLVATKEKAYLVTETIDETNWSVKLEVKNGLTELRSVCDHFGYTVLKINGTWFVTAKFPLTDTMVGLVVDTSINRMSTAFSELGNAFETAAEKISKIV